ncbi:unnamed protein product [Litomosoides sigmodontis]|uniref:Uncharacterized protein n=1 Tax=Litomosoides sigmodontis TaxID=42156 RepID=A0A3P6SXZ0_LITSI|nr:unnamed protein product [Litomosoides sigmodontis]
MPPDDLLGRHGPKLEQFLTKRNGQSQSQGPMRESLNYGEKKATAAKPLLPPPQPQLSVASNQQKTTTVFPQNLPLPPAKGSCLNVREDGLSSLQIRPPRRAMFVERKLSDVRISSLHRQLSGANRN